MRIEASVLQKLTIHDADGLDPVHVFLEDHGVGKGEVTIKCYDRSWTAYWGAMGQEDVRQFILTADVPYLANCLSRGIRDTVFSGEALAKLARQVILGRRRSSLRAEVDETRIEYSAQEARDWYEQADDLKELTEGSFMHGPDALLRELFGPEWWYMGDRAQDANPAYTYLSRIVRVVQAALKTLPAPTVAEAA